MSVDELTHKLGVLVGAVMIGAGILIGIRLITRLPAPISAPAVGAVGGYSAIAIETHPSPLQTPATAPTAHSIEPRADPAQTYVVGVADDLPIPLLDTLVESGARIVRVPWAEPNADVDLALGYGGQNSAGGQPIYGQVFVVAGRFDTPIPSLPWNQVQSAWQGDNRRYSTLAVIENTVSALESIMGPRHQSLLTFEARDGVLAALRDGTADLAIVAFDELVPELSVFEIDAQNPLDTGQKFRLSQYPLVATVYAYQGSSSIDNDRLSDLLGSLPRTNRDPDLMTSIAMTGVTAMVRFTAARMDQRGPDWPAAVVGPDLANADITAISNEVPFVEGCETDLDPDNLVFCSKPEYIQALLASGTDIVGLTGNHLNDYGHQAALQSLQYYADAGLQIYGGGADKASAMKPLIIEHNGNRIAFLGANSYGPPVAWAGDNHPGSAPFDLNIMSAMIRSLKSGDEADVVFAELQYQESYDAAPLEDQRQDFRALVRAGADVVTGVQSHVPQAIEFLSGKLMLYGLGNLYFDQMWSADTREGLIVKHTVYDGRHISTRLLPTILYDYGQPRWASTIDRARILQRVFDALPLE
jgi:hypothetical protein